MKKILDHIIWILIVVAIAATAAVSIVSEALSHSGGFLDFPWWISAVLLLFKIAPWLFLAIELLITIRDSASGERRTNAEIGFNAAAVVLAVFGAAAVVLEADSFLIFAISALWMIVRIVDAIAFRRRRERTNLLKSPVFFIVTAVLIVIVVVLAVVLCDRGEKDPDEYTGEFSSETILEAWEGEFDEEKLKTAIGEYEKSCSAYVLTEAEANVPFFLTLNYEPKSAKVVRLAPADPKDSGFELKTYIDMTLSPTCVGNNVAVAVEWWYSEHESSWTRDYTLWSYLLCVKDADDGEHYYYFRVSYSESTDTASDDTVSDDTVSDVTEVPDDGKYYLIGKVVSSGKSQIGLCTCENSHTGDIFSGVDVYVTTKLEDGTTVMGFTEGDTVKVCYDGMVAESYPEQIFNVYSIEILDSVKTESYEPPYMPAFDSFEDIAELKDMLYKTDSEIEEYLDSNNFSMNGVSSREDVVDLFDRIGGLVMLYLDDESGYEPKSIIYYVDYGYIQLIYGNGNDKIRIFCYLDGGNGVENTVTAETLDRESAGEIDIMGETVCFYKIEEENFAYKFHAFLCTENSDVEVMFSSDDENVVKKSAQYIMLSTLNDLIEK